MWPDPVSNPGPLTYESGALPTALCGPANKNVKQETIWQQGPDINCLDLFHTLISICKHVL